MKTTKVGRHRRKAPIERYSPERKAEFLLSTATTKKDYQRARAEVRNLGLDPDKIHHRRPA